MGDLGVGLPGCNADTLPVHQDPVDLVREFVTRDTAGRIDDGDWALGAVTCEERLDSDIVDVVVGAGVAPVMGGSDSTRVLVSFESRFTLEWDSAGTSYHLAVTASRRADTVLVIHTRRGWRIHEIDARASLSPEAALRRLPHLDSLDRSKLLALRSRAGA